MRWYELGAPQGSDGFDDTTFLTEAPAGTDVDVSFHRGHFDAGEPPRLQRLRTCYYRTFNVSYATPSQLDAYRSCREWLDAAIALMRPGATTDQIAAVWPEAQEFGQPDERAALGLQFGHGIGVGLYESPGRCTSGAPICSRARSW